MKNILALPCLLAVMAVSPAAFSKVGCSIAKVISRDSVTQNNSYSTGFAIQSNALIVNDHSLAEGAKEVEVWVDGQKTQGLVKGRDFHTDLAVIALPAGSMTTCPLASEPPKSIDRVELAGMEKEDFEVSVQVGLVKNPNSKKLLIPGIQSGIEVIGTDGDNISIRKSNSGSPLFVNGKVIGMLAQETKYGTGLALPAEQIRQMAPVLLAQTDIKRAYKYDHRDGKFEFRGLEMKPENQMRPGESDPKTMKRFMEMNGNPHESGNPHENKIQKNWNDLFQNGNPHDGKREETKIGAYGPGQTTMTVSLEDYNLGAAVANLGNFEVLKRHQPELARVLAKGNIKQIFISSIDGIRVSSLFEMIQVLGSCRSCIIDGYWISHKQSEQIENPSMRAIGLMTQLITALEKEKDGVNFVRSLMPEMEVLNRLLALDARLLEINMRNPLVVRSLNRQWERIDANFASRWLSEQSLEILSQLRLAIPAE
jgi:hypothetical protein